MPCCHLAPPASPSAIPGGSHSAFTFLASSQAGHPTVEASVPCPPPMALLLPLTFCSSTQGREFPRSILPLWPSPFWGDQSRSEPEWGRETSPALPGASHVLTRQLGGPTPPPPTLPVACLRLLCSISSRGHSPAGLGREESLFRPASLVSPTCNHTALPPSQTQLPQDLLKSLSLLAGLTLPLTWASGLTPGGAEVCGLQLERI